MFKKSILKATLFSIMAMTAVLSHSQTWGSFGDTISGNAPFDGMGTSVSLTSNASFIATGSYRDNGYVKVHQMINNVWVQLGQTIEGDAINPGCGRSAKIVGDNINNLRVAVGCASYSFSPTLQGAAVVYEYNTNTQLWEQLGQTLLGENPVDNFGVSVAMSEDGNTLAVGADFNDGNGSLDCGHVRVFEWTNGSWVMETEIDGLSAGDKCGLAVTLNDNGSVLAIGSPFSDLGTSQAGNIRVFQKSGSVWNQSGGTIIGDAFGELGSSLALSADGSRLAAGCPFAVDPLGSPNGYGVVYEFDQTNWVENSPRYFGDYAYYVAGISVDLSSDGKTIVIGSSEDTNLAWLAGSVSVFREGASGWNIVDAQIEANAYAGLYGRNVSINEDGNVIAIGSPATFENDPLSAGNCFVHTLILSSSLSLSDHNSIDSQIKAYPNPFVDVLRIESEKTFSLKITDLQGKDVSFTSSINNAVMTVNLSHLSAGPYIGIITDENGNVTRKSLVKK